MPLQSWVESKCCTFSSCVMDKHNFLNIRVGLVQLLTATCTQLVMLAVVSQAVGGVMNNKSAFLVCLINLTSSFVPAGFTMLAILLVQSAVSVHPESK